MPWMVPWRERSFLLALFSSFSLFWLFKILNLKLLQSNNEKSFGPRKAEWNHAHVVFVAWKNRPPLHPLLIQYTFSFRSTRGVIVYLFHRRILASLALSILPNFVRFDYPIYDNRDSNIPLNPLAIGSLICSGLTTTEITGNNSGVASFKTGFDSLGPVLLDTERRSLSCFYLCQSWEETLRKNRTSGPKHKTDLCSAEWSFGQGACMLIQGVRYKVYVHWCKSWLFTEIVA